eukprot:TRINITY_DN1686_c0_g1_i1.p1 TRINITY_DN1686_c0_g1~~TRINITY_DN1686_c0_g1_i1.p1  ORF type:complete len:180 (+),score=73.97 TRINITY_DN1686_c0_g1_i1:55-540(+)
MAATTTLKNGLEIASHLVKLTKPQFVNGCWHKPKLTPLMLSKGIIKEKESWLQRPDTSSTFVPKEKKPYDRRLNPKGHKFQRERAAREKMIEDKLKKMPQLIKAHHEELKKLRNDQAKKELFKALFDKYPEVKQAKSNEKAALSSTKTLKGGKGGKGGKGK